MKTTITADDVEKAQREYTYGSGIELANCCPVHQAIKRITGKPIRVGYGWIQINGSQPRLNGNAYAMTRNPTNLWPSFIGQEIEIPEL